MDIVIIIMLDIANHVIVSYRKCELWPINKRMWVCYLDTKTCPQGQYQSNLKSFILAMKRTHVDGWTSV